MTLGSADRLVYYLFNAKTVFVSSFNYLTLLAISLRSLPMKSF